MENGKNYLEQNVVVYPKFKYFSDWVFVSGNCDKIDKSVLSMAHADDMKVT